MLYYRSLSLVANILCGVCFTMCYHSETYPKTHSTVDNINPAGPSVPKLVDLWWYNVYQVMQDVYHQQKFCGPPNELPSILNMLGSYYART